MIDEGALDDVVDGLVRVLLCSSLRLNLETRLSEHTLLRLVEDHGRPRGSMRLDEACQHAFSILSTRSSAHGT